MSSRRTAAGMVSQSLDRRRDGESDVQPRVYRQSAGPGLASVSPECSPDLRIVVAASRTFAPGSTVQTGRNSGRPGEAIITEPVPGHRGASAFPRDVVRRELDVVRIVSADPEVVVDGATTEVTLTGIGFRESPVDSFRAVRGIAVDGSWSDDPDVTAGAATWIDSETVTLPVTVASGIGPPEGDPGPPRYISLEVERS